MINRSLRHPNIVQYIGAAEFGGRWFLVTELCRYKSLQDLLAAPTMRPQLTWLTRKRMMKEAALGISLWPCFPLSVLRTHHIYSKGDSVISFHRFTLFTCIQDCSYGHQTAEFPCKVTPPRSNHLTIAPNTCHLYVLLDNAMCTCR
jgi:hypothetical protein